MVQTCGIVTLRQQPQTAGGTVSVSLKDEGGAIQVIVWKRVRERQRQALLASILLGVYGKWQSEDGVRSLVTQQLVDLSSWLGKLATPNQDFK